MYDTLIKIPVTLETMQAVTDLDFAHKAVMSRFPDLQGAAAGARAAMGILFHLGLPGEPGENRSAISLRVRSLAPLEGADLAQLPVAGETLRVKVQVVAERRLSTTVADQRITKTRPVRDEEVEQWLIKMFEYFGFSVTEGSLQVSQMRKRGKDGEVHYWIRDVQAVVSVFDEEKAQEAWVGGVGRGKSYGLGMLRRI